MCASVTRFAILATALTLIGAGCKPLAQRGSNSAGEVAAADCVPSYRELGKDPVVANVGGPMVITARWVAIGCRAELARASDKELEQARTVLSTIMKEEVYHLLTVPKDASRRDAFARRINAAIGRRLMTDLYMKDLVIPD